MEAATTGATNNGNTSSSSSQPSGSVQGSKAPAAAPKGTPVVSQNSSQGTRNSGTAVESNAGQSEGSSQDAGGISSENPKGSEVGKAEGDPSHIWTVRIKGEERKYDIRDPEQANYVRKQLQKVDGADKALEESSLTKKQAKQFYEALRTNPAAVLQAMGHNLDELAKNHLAQVLQLEAMDPKDRAIMERDQQLEQYRRSETEKKAAEEAAQAKIEDDRAREKWDRSITEELTKHSELPPTPYTIALTAKYILEGRKLGYKDITPADVMKTVENHYKSDFRMTFGKMTIEKAMEYLPEEFMTRLREHDIQKITDPTKQEFAKKPDAKPLSPVRRDFRKKGLNWKEYQAELDKRIANLPK